MKKGEQCCCDWQLDGVCFANKRSFGDFLVAMRVNKHHLVINKNKGTQQERTNPINKYLWTNKDADLMVITGNNPFGSETQCENESMGYKGTVRVKSIELSGNWKKVKKAVDWLRREKLLDPKADKEKKRGYRGRKRVVNIGHEEECTRSLFY